MDTENKAVPEKENDNAGSAVKKIIVPVALTVGLLGNAVAVDNAVNVHNAGADSAEYFASDGFDTGSSPVTFDDDVEDDEDNDEEKRTYKGRNLAKASVGASPLILPAAAQSGMGEYLRGVALTVFSFSARFLGVFFILSVLFMGMFRALYPGRKLGEIVNKKNILRILAASVFIFGVIYIADDLTKQKNIFLELIKNGSVLAVMLILWYKIFELKGKFGKIMKDLFWGKKGKIVILSLAGFNVLMSILHMVYNTFYTANSFTSLLVFYIICVASVFGIYIMCRGRMVEDDELES